MSEKRWLSFVLGLTTVISLGAVTNVVAQSVYPVRFDDGQPGETQDDTSLAAATQSGASALTVEGEVLTVDSSGEPRLWGRGRPGTKVWTGVLGSVCTSQTVPTVKFGLSEIEVQWGAAADACPQGTWVCTLWERGAASCDTLRTDTLVDAYDCKIENINFNANAHVGWVADVSQVGQAVAENAGGTVAGRQVCDSYPVWCCWE